MTTFDRHVSVSVAKSRGSGTRAKRRSRGRTDAKTTTVTVSPECRISIGLAEYIVASSDRYGSTLADKAWSAAIRHVATECRRTGASKGRVLYLLEKTHRTGLVPVAVLPYHLESAKELEVRAAESALSVKDREPAFVSTLLLVADAIIRRYPDRQGSGRLVWKVSRADARTIKERYDFRQAGVASDARVLLERRVEGT